VLTTPEFPQGLVVRGRNDARTATAAVRPEDVEISEPGDSGPGAEGTVLDAVYLGDHYRYLVAVGSVLVTVHSRRQLAGGPLRLRIPPGVASFVD
jgi:ABC-type Fe3+/spermidine/putrescine transport system ATPase subunit